jgi:hypothetical protein
MQQPKKIQAAHVEKLDDEVCVYDLERKVVHNLNPTAALVWEQCDGATSPDQIAQTLQEELDTPHAEDVVWVTLNELEQANLLEIEVVQPADRPLITRRTLLKQMGVAAALAPVIVSIVAPNPAQAQTPGGGGGGGTTGTWQAAGAGAGAGDGLDLTAGEVAADAAALCGGAPTSIVGDPAASAVLCAAAAAALPGADWFRFGLVAGVPACTIIIC